MFDSVAATCPRCGAGVPKAFVGRICARCVLASMAPDAPSSPGSGYEPLPADPASGELKVGACFGDYELIDLLGRGGMAVVFLARQVSLDRLVALKTVGTLVDTGIQAQERFRREARAVARLDHPSIVSVHDVGTAPGALYYTMDYIEGTDLGRALRQRQFTARESVSLVRTLADAMDYAHRRGVVHRDLKPANILLDGDGAPHVADFGLAIETEQPGRLTLTGDFVGTPPYMAPERLSGGKNRAEAAGDIYALGAILFQMLTGRTPFIAESPSEILDLVLHEQPPAPRLLNPKISPDVETICLKCLEKSPAARYATAGALGEDLGRFLAGEPILARRASIPARLWRWSRRRPALAMFVLALMLGSLGATGAAIEINSSRRQAVRSEAAAREQLWLANLAHAQAARRTTRAGARGEALGAIRDAARYRASTELRNEAIAALSLPEAGIVQRWPLLLEDQAAVAFDPTLLTYVAEVSPGLLVRRKCDGDLEIGRLDRAGVKILGTPVFSPDGHWLAARYADAVVRVWDVAAGKTAFDLPDRKCPVGNSVANYCFDLSFNSDSTRLSVSRPAGGFTVHETQGGSERGQWTSEFPATIVRFSPDGRHIAAASRFAPSIAFIDAGTMTTSAVATLPTIPICAVWEPAGDKLAAGLRNARVPIIEAASGKILDTFAPVESGAVGQIVFQPHAPVFFLGAGDGGTRFYDANTGRLLLSLDGAMNRPVAAFDASGTRISAYNSFAQRASIIQIQGSPIYAAVSPPRPVRSAISAGALAQSADGRWLATGESGAVRLRDRRSGAIVSTYEGDPEDRLTVQFSGDSTALLVCGNKSGLHRHDIVGGQIGAAAPILNDPAFHLEGSTADGRLLLVSDETETVRVLPPAEPQNAISWHVGKVCAAAFSPDGQRLLTQAGQVSAGEPAVRVWDLATRREVGSFGDDAGGRIECSRAGGTVLVTGDRATQLWVGETGRRGPELPAELQGETHHAALSPDGSMVVIEKDHQLHLLSARSGVTLAVFSLDNLAGICVNELFSADGQQLTALWQYGSAHVWDLSALHQELRGLELDWRQK